MWHWNVNKRTNGSRLLLDMPRWKLQSDVSRLWHPYLKNIQINHSTSTYGVISRLAVPIMANLKTICSADQQISFRVPKVELLLIASLSKTIAICVRIVTGPNWPSDSCSVIQVSLHQTLFNIKSYPDLLCVGGTPKQCIWAYFSEVVTEGKTDGNAMFLMFTNYPTKGTVFTVLKTKYFRHTDSILFRAIQPLLVFTAGLAKTSLCWWKTKPFMNVNTAESRSKLG